MITLPCEDRDFPEWHGGCRHALVWVIELPDPRVQASLEEASGLLGDLLLPRYDRQPHVTVAFVGLAPQPGATPAERVYLAADLDADLARLSLLPPGPVGLRLGGWGSFSTVPYLAARAEGLAPVREALLLGRPRDIRYTPHVTLGHYRVAVPIEEVARRLAPWRPVELDHEVTELTLARYDTNDVAGPLTPVGRFGLSRGAWHAA